MSRLIWLALAGAATALVIRKGSRPTTQVAVRGFGASVAAGLADLLDSAGSFVAEVRAASGERERELRAAAGLDAGEPGSGASEWAAG